MSSVFVCTRYQLSVYTVSIHTNNMKYCDVSMATLLTVCTLSICTNHAYVTIGLYVSMSV